MDAAFLNQPSYLYPIVVQSLLPLVFPRCLKVSRGRTLQDDANMSSDVIHNT